MTVDYIFFLSCVVQLLLFKYISINFQSCTKIISSIKNILGTNLGSKIVLIIGSTTTEI